MKYNSVSRHNLPKLTSLVGTTSVPYGWLSIETYTPKTSKPFRSCPAELASCLHDGVEFDSACVKQGSVSFVMVVANCTSVALKVSPRIATTKMRASAYWANSTGSYSVSTYESLVIGDNYAIMSQCNGNGNDTLRIQVACSVDGPGNNYLTRF